MSDKQAVPAPVPIPDEASAPFFDGAREGRLVLQRCGVCGTYMWPVRPRCVECFSTEVGWSEVSGRGTLYTFTLVHQLTHPAFADRIPYNLAMIDLEEGVRMTANVVDCPNEDLRIGMPLEVVFEAVSADVSIPQFRPAGT